MFSKNHLQFIQKRLRNKSFTSPAVYKISAVAYSHKGEILGYATNNIREQFLPARRGAGIHAERTLIKKYGKKIKYIVISRFGNQGDMLPIQPCEICQKVANNLGIKIIELSKNI